MASAYDAKPFRARALLAAGIVGVLSTVMFVVVTALMQFVDLTAATRQTHTESDEPPELPPLPERVGAMPESPTTLRALLAARTRLQPDRRVLIAVADLHRFATSVADASQARFDADRWTVLHGNTIVGPLPEVPSYAALATLLDTWADKLTPRLRIRPTRPEPLSSEAVAWRCVQTASGPQTILERLGSQWTRGARNTALLAEAARALVAMTLATNDRLELADDLTARAMATVALARIAGADMRDADALLAAHMGYTAEARTLADSLADHDSVKAFVHRDVQRLAALAADTRRGAFARMLHAWLVDEVRNRDEHTPATTIDTLVATLDAAPRVPVGPFVDQALLSARDRANAFTLFDDHLADQRRRNGAQAARELCDQLSSRPVEAGRSTVDLLAALARVDAGAERAETLLRRVMPGQHVSGALAARAAARIEGLVARESPRRRQSFEFLVTHLDTRTVHRALLSRVALDDVHDLTLAQTLCQQLALSTELDEVAPWCRTQPAYVPPPNDLHTTLAARVEELWRRAAFTDAARVLATERAWRVDPRATFAVGTAFARVFSAQPHARALDATRALVAAGVSARHVAALGEAWGDASATSMAIAVIDALSDPDAIAGLELRVASWQHRRRARDEATATAWLRSRVPRPLRGALAMAAFRARADALLWTVVEPVVDDVAHREYVWLLRAATSARAGEGDAHRAAVVAHYTSPDANEYAVIGRYLVGRAELRSVLALDENEALRAPIAFYLGLKAEHDGRRLEASDWYQLARLMGTTREREFIWADESAAALIRLRGSP